MKRSKLPATIVTIMVFLAAAGTLAQDDVQSRISAILDEVEAFIVSLQTLEQRIASLARRIQSEKLKLKFGHQEEARFDDAIQESDDRRHVDERIMQNLKTLLGEYRKRIQKCKPGESIVIGDREFTRLTLELEAESAVLEFDQAKLRIVDEERHRAQLVLDRQKLRTDLIKTRTRIRKLELLLERLKLLLVQKKVSARAVPRPGEGSTLSSLEEEVKALFDQVAQAARADEIVEQLPAAREIQKEVQPKKPITIRIDEIMKKN